MRGQFEKPIGLSFYSEFLSIQEEIQLLHFLDTLVYEQVVLHGIAAKRTVKHFGYLYDYKSRNAVLGEPIPKELIALQMKSEQIAGLSKGEFAQCLINNYPAKSTIGWHVDSPVFGPKIMGISLNSDCMIRFQKRVDDIRFVFEQELPRRSAYMIDDQARYQWQHHIPPTPAQRYSITFRTLSESMS